jgi:hypothetical protein
MRGNHFVVALDIVMLGLLNMRMGNYQVFSEKPVYETER